MPNARPIYVGNILTESTAFTFATITVSVILWVLFFLVLWAAFRKKAQPLRVFGISFYLPIGFICLYCMWISSAIVIAFLEQKYGITSTYKAIDFSYTVYREYSEKSRAIELYSIPIPFIVPWPSFSTRDPRIISPLENFLPSPTLSYGCDLAILLIVIVFFIVTAAVIRMVSLHNTHQKWVQYADAQYAFIQTQSQALSASPSWPSFDIPTQAPRNRRRSTTSRSPSPSLKTPLLNPLPPPPAPPSPESKQLSLDHASSLDAVSEIPSSMAVSHPPLPPYPGTTPSPPDHFLAATFSLPENPDSLLAPPSPSSFQIPPITPQLSQSSPTAPQAPQSTSTPSQSHLQSQLSQPPSQRPSPRLLPRSSSSGSLSALPQTPTRRDSVTELTNTATTQQSLSRSSSHTSLTMLGLPLAPHVAARTRSRKHSAAAAPGLSRTNTPKSSRPSTSATGTPRASQPQQGGGNVGLYPRGSISSASHAPTGATVTTTTVTSSFSPAVSVTVVTTHGSHATVPNARSLASSRAAQTNAQAHARARLRDRSRSTTPSNSRQSSPTRNALAQTTHTSTTTLVRSSSSRSAPSSRDPSPATRVQLSGGGDGRGFGVSINMPVDVAQPERPPARPHYTQLHTWLRFAPILGLVSLLLIAVAPLLTLPHDYLLVYLSHAHASTSQPSSPPTAFILALVLVFVLCFVILYAAVGVVDPFLTIATGRRVAIIGAVLTGGFPLLHLVYKLCRSGADNALDVFMSATSEIFVVASCCYLLIVSFTALLFVVLVPLYLSFKPRVWCVWPTPAQLASPEACLDDMVALHWLTAFLDAAPPSAALPPSSIIQLWMALEVYRDAVRRLTGTVCSRVLITEDLSRNDDGDEDVGSDHERVDDYHRMPQTRRQEVCSQCNKVPRACANAVYRLAVSVYQTHIASQRRLFISPGCRNDIIATIESGAATLHTFDRLRLELKSLISIAHGAFLVSPYLDHCRRAMDVQCGLRRLMVDAGMLGPPD